MDSPEAQLRILQYNLENILYLLHIQLCTYQHQLLFLHYIFDSLHCHLSSKKTTNPIIKDYYLHYTSKLGGHNSNNLLGSLYGRDNCQYKQLVLCYSGTDILDHFRNYQHKPLAKRCTLSHTDQPCQSLGSFRQHSYQTIAYRHENQRPLLKRLKRKTSF